MKYQFIVSVLILCLSVSCKNRKPVEIVDFDIDTSITKTSKNEFAIAKPIIYDVIIENMDSLDEWKEECLQGLEKEKLINLIFDQLYKGEIEAYDFFSNELLTPKDIKKMEKREGYSRDKIGKIQFYENWVIDTANLKIRKEVTDYVLGYHTMDFHGELIGYKPLFRIPNK